MRRTYVRCRATGLSARGRDARLPARRRAGLASPSEDRGARRARLPRRCLQPAQLDPCDQVGLYVWLRRPARQVTAHLAGRRLCLRERAAPSIRPGTHWEALLNNARLEKGPLAVEANERERWFGEPDVNARIRLQLRFMDQPGLTRVLRTPLRAGYG